MDFQTLRVRLSGQPELEYERIICASREQRERWTARRACWRHGQFQKQTYQLRRAHKHTTVCTECGALVDLQAARRSAALLAAAPSSPAKAVRENRALRDFGAVESL